MDALKTWNTKLAADKPYSNFKIHLREEYHALHQAGELKIIDSSVNMLKDITEH